MATRRILYPTARMADVVDDYHGVRVADPYRWLEDDNSAETHEWIHAQNALTRATLDGSRRRALVETLTSLYDFPRTSVPFKRGDRYFFTRNSGLQNQPVLYVQDGPDGLAKVLLDPNVLNEAGTTALTAAAASEDGARIAYALSYGGSDRQEIFVRDVASATDLPDRLEWAKFTSIAWTKDGRGFYYTRFPAPGTVPAGDENYFNQAYYHRLGDDQSRDQLVFERPFEREVVIEVAISADDRWVVLTASQGSSDKSEIHLLDRHQAGAAPQPLFEGFRASFVFIESAAGRLFFKTDEDAPLGRIVAVNPEAPAHEPIVVVAERADKLSTVVIADDALAAVYMHHASDRLELFDLTGQSRGLVTLPSVGSIPGLSGQPGERELLIGFTSFVHPVRAWRADPSTRSLSPFGPAEAPIDPSGYETEQVWYPSGDGTRVSMFLVYRKGLQRDGNRPVLLTGYGGFNISLTPAFDPAIFPLLDRGGIHAVANLRGGGEYGETWHEAGMLERKQNVFDDFVAAARWLATEGYTRPSRLAIEGGSNGGLLTGAVMVQQPDCFGAIVCRVPVADMLRYHLFTVGRFWISEYGSADSPDQFPYLLKYSPYHNVSDRAVYPPILITTADTDDRVAPGMARKFAARLQAAAGNPSPVLIRIETSAGHGAGKPVSKVIEEDADILTFVFQSLGVE
jgi:prolyl oligopeptidase